MDLRIAITDDLNSEREKLSSAIIAPFEKVGLNVGNIDEYTSGEELLRQFSAGRYDLIFLDIYMGGMSGVETYTFRQRKTACRNACTADAE